jgi:hypothetical protein
MQHYEVSGTLTPPIDLNQLLSASLDLSLAARDCMCAHSKDENQFGEWCTIRLQYPHNLLIISYLAERVGFETIVQRSFM